MSKENKIQCPKCKKHWPIGCEQAIAINKRGKCILCIVKAGETFETNPYEFKVAHDWRESLR